MRGEGEFFPWFSKMDTHMHALTTFGLVLRCHIIIESHSRQFLFPFIAQRYCFFSPFPFPLSSFPASICLPISRYQIFGTSFYPRTFTQSPPAKLAKTLPLASGALGGYAFLNWMGLLVRHLHGARAKAK